MKPGATNASFNADKLECIQTASATVGSQAEMGSMLFVAAAEAGYQHQKQEVFNTCMQAKGYTLQQDPSQSPTMPPTSVAESCANVRNNPDPSIRTLGQIYCAMPDGRARIERGITRNAAAWPYLTPAARKEFFGGEFDKANVNIVMAACDITPGMTVPNPLPATLVDRVTRQRLVTKERNDAWLQSHGVPQQVIDMGP